MRVTLKLIVSAAILLTFSFSSFSQQVAKTIPYSTSPDGVIGFLQFTPPDYGSQKHPLIIFLHGIGERGNGTSQINSVANNGTPYYCSKGATMRFTVGGQTSSFVVLSPQLSTQYGYWPTFYVKEMIKYAKANLQIDPNRIYITGLSLGGGGTWRVITDTENFDNSFDASIAAAAPVCGTQEENDNDFCNTIGANHLPVWAFHAMDDGTVGVGATQHAEILAKNCGVTPAPIFTYYQNGGHGGAWINAYDTGHITRAVVVNGVVSNFTANPNLYEWFLSKTRGGQTAPTYTAPVANAGAAQTITLPISVVTLTGSGTGTNGATISSYSWTKTSGPSAGLISLPLLNTTLVTGLVQGTYVFTLTVTDNHGLTSTSSVSVVVNAGAAYTAPVANAGSAQTITLPSNAVTLSGSGTGTNGATISSYSWVKSSGPSAGLINQTTSASTSVTGLAQGNYIFTLTVTDNHGLSSTSSVTIVVNAAAYTAPVANAGGSQTITLPANSVTLSGSGTGTNGASISSYSWVKSSGPSAGTISQSTAASTTVTGLAQGNYIFTLTVTDNHGLSSTSSVTIVVNAAAVYTAPTVSAGSTQTITLPANSVTLNGAASGTNGAWITAYSWVKSSGPTSSTINTGWTASTTVTDLVQSPYIFTLTVTDNHGLTSSANVSVIVNAPSGTAGRPGTTEQPIGYIKMSTGSYQACDDKSTSGRTAVYGSSIANDNLLYLDADHKQLFDGGWNWYSFSASADGAVTQAFAVYPNGSVNLLTNCSGAPVTPPVTTPPVAEPPAAGTLVGYVKMSTGPYQACADNSTSGRIALYGSSIGNGNIVYTDAALTQVFNGGWNWYSFSETASGSVTQAFAVFPNGSINLLKYCSGGSPVDAPPATTPPVTTPPATGSNLVGYIKISTGPYQACDDASSSGRTAVYGKGIANDNILYTDAAMTQKFDGGWNWFSFTPTLGGGVTQAFAIYPTGGILLLRACGSSSARMVVAANATTAEQDIATLRSIKDSATLSLSVAVIKPVKLVLYPNPVTSSATIELYSAENSVKTINMFDAKGVLRAKYTWQTIKGNNIFSLKNIQGLANGLYVIDIRETNGKPAGTLKFLKIK